MVYCVSANILLLCHVTQCGIDIIGRERPGTSSLQIFTPENLPKIVHFQTFIIFTCHPSQKEYICQKLPCYTYNPNLGRKIWALKKCWFTDIIMTSCFHRMASSAKTQTWTANQGLSYREVLVLVKRLVGTKVSNMAAICEKA